MITKELIQSSLILDVRTPEEFSQGHFPGAVHIPLDLLEEKLSVLKAAGKPIVAYCKSGYRSEVAAKFLKQHQLEAYNGMNLETLNRCLG